MKEIVYSLGNEKKVFLLTNDEFKEAVSFWEKGLSYYCVRMDSVLSKYYKWIETPLDEKGHEVFIQIKNGMIRKIFKKDDQYYSSINNEDGTKRKFPINIDKKETLISQEDFYKDKKLLK